MPALLCRLYLITPPALPDLDAFAGVLEQALSAGDVAALQVRLKGAGPEEVARAVARIGPIARARDVALILNDDPHLAARLGCDGVHVGQSDASVAEARRIMGAGAMIGATCHDSRHLAMEASEAGADYVAFGAFFPTSTKAAPALAELELLTIWQETMQTPCVAIGGITPDNAETIALAGADFAAVSAGAWAWPDGPAAAVSALNAALASGAAAQRRARANEVGFKGN